MQALRLSLYVSHMKYVCGHRKLCDVLLRNSVTYNVCRGMAGHSKWANIRHTKAAKDAERMKAFLKFSRMMKVAIKEGGSADPKLNSKLGKVVEIARSNNMPVVSIENVLKSSQKSQDNAKPYMLEYRGPGGVFLLAEILTDSISRTKQSVVAATRKLNVQEVKGAARHMFHEKGVIVATSKGTSYETAMDSAIEVGAEDVDVEDEHFVFTCASQDFMNVKRGLETLNFVIESASVDFLPINPVTIGDQDRELLEIVIQKLENMDDVMKVHVNL